MALFMLYIIKLSCCLTLFYLGYKFLLSNETFFHFNRNVLLTGIWVCMVIPLIKIRMDTPNILQQPLIRLENIMIEEEQSGIIPVNYLSVSNETITAPSPTGRKIPPVSLVRLLVLIFAAGGVVNIGLLIRSHISLCHLIRSGKKIKRGKHTLVLFDKPVTPFNYGRYVILSENDFRENAETILTHELAHSRLSHSFDVVLMELITLLQWFNPVAWALKREVRKVHEFQADAEVLKTGIDATNYQLLLVRKAVDTISYPFASNFNQSKLKNRFTMMTKKQSNSWARLKLLLLLPVAALFVYACARPNDNRQLEQMSRGRHSTSVSVEPTEEPLISLVFTDNTGKELRSFNIRNDDVIGYALDIESSAVSELEKWLKNQKKEDFQYFRISIKASKDTPMGVITDIKQLLLNASNAAKN